MVEINTPQCIGISAWSMLSALGDSNDTHWENVKQMQTGIRQINDLAPGLAPFYGSRVLPEFYLRPDLSAAGYTAFEQLAIAAIQNLLKQNPNLDFDQELLFILSTTKGNISLIGTTSDSEIGLHFSAKKIAQYFKLRGKIVVISQACVSGVVAMNYAQMMLNQNRFQAALICGADILSHFVLSGFQSFQAIAGAPCRPFDKDRSGINLGEAAACLFLEKNEKPEFCLNASYTSNDANHISGPSRTGHELGKCIAQVLEKSKVLPHEVDMVSAHGTATLYNDEMEAKAFTFAGINRQPIHSLKSYIGHTLGAAGVIETAMCLEAMKRGAILPSLSFEQSGVASAINICTQSQASEVTHVVKTASGFGGTNAALLLSKQEP